MATAPKDLVFKFDTTTDTSQIFALTTDTLAEGETGISFDLQIVEKFGGTSSFGGDYVGSTVIGTGTQKISKATAQDLANLITRFFADKSILTSATDGIGGTGRNIRSMKLIVNVDPIA